MWNNVPHSKTIAKISFTTYSSINLKSLASLFSTIFNKSDTFIPGDLDIIQAESSVASLTSFFYSA
jgi:hypothetical protein